MGKMISYRRALRLRDLEKFVQGYTAQFDSWVGKIPWRRDRLPTPVFLGFPGGSDGKESACSAGDLGLIPGSGRSPGGEHGSPLRKIPMDRGALRVKLNTNE